MRAEVMSGIEIGTSCVSNANHTQGQCFVKVVNWVLGKFSGNVRLDGAILFIYKSLN